MDGIKKIHFVGIKGVAMTALAMWAKEQGIEVTGSDIPEQFSTDEILKQAGIDIYENFSPEHVSGDTVIYTGAHGGKDNIEVQEAFRRNIPAYAHGQALGMLMAKKKQISIAGCHGKTTTTAMTASILLKNGCDPSYVIGSGAVRGLGLPGHAGTGSYFIAEADEYVTDPKHDLTPRFLWQKPEILVITTIDYDHPDVYPTMESVRNAYKKLVDGMVGEKTLIWNANDAESITLLSHYPHALTYGYKDADLIIEQTDQKPVENTGIFHYQGKTYPISLSVPGKHNLLNAAAAFLVACSVGIKPTAIIESLQEFRGAARRFEYIGTLQGVTVIDDYAHHPQEIQSTIGAAREWYPDHRLTVVFQPHTYSRTESLFSEFSMAFQDADLVRILPIYASSRETKGTITSEKLVAEVAKHHKDVSYWHSVEDLITNLSGFSASGDVIICMGAGDIGRNVRELIGKHNNL